MAHRQGLALPMKDFHTFRDHVTMPPGFKNSGLDMMNRYFKLVELIQSSPDAVMESVHATIGGSYRHSNVVVNELRFCPMKRNRGGERDLDYIIMSAIWGAERAMIEYPQVKAGIILMMDRELTYEQNAIIAKKAITYQDRGVVGLDVAGPNRSTFDMVQHARLFAMARDAGLGITVHTGEIDQLEEMRYVVDEIEPDRIGHGIESVRDQALMEKLIDKDITLEICPSSNILNQAVPTEWGLSFLVRRLLDTGVKITVCTDGPELYRTNITNEFAILLRTRTISKDQMALMIRWGREASFIS